MKDRWESDFPTTGNGLYSLVAVGPSGHPTRVKQPPGTSPVQGYDDVEPVSGSGFGKRNQSRGETSFSIRAGAKREVRRAKGWRRTDGRTVFVPSCLTTPRSYGLVGTAISGAAVSGGVIVCPSRDMRKPVALTKSPAPLMREAQVRL